MFAFLQHWMSNVAFMILRFSWSLHIGYEMFFIGSKSRLLVISYKPVSRGHGTSKQTNRCRLLTHGWMICLKNTNTRFRRKNTFSFQSIYDFQRLLINKVTIFIRIDKYTYCILFWIPRWKFSEAISYIFVAFVLYYWLKRTVSAGIPYKTYLCVAFSICVWKVLYNWWRDQC